MSAQARQLLKLGLGEALASALIEEMEMISLQFARRLLLSITLPLVALTATMAAGEQTRW